MSPFFTSWRFVILFQTLINWSRTLRESIINFLISKDFTHIEKCKGKYNKHYALTTQLCLSTIVIFAVKASCVHILGLVALIPSPELTGSWFEFNYQFLYLIIMGQGSLICHIGEIIYFFGLPNDYFIHLISTLQLRCKLEP